MTPSEQNRLTVIQKVYEQQKYMYDNRTHSVPDRIVSLSQPWVRPIVRGKAGKPVEFGAKLDICVVDGFNKLENEQQQQVLVMLETSVNLSRSHWYKEKFLEILDCNDRETAKEKMQEWINNASNCGIPQFEKCADTMQNWLAGILNSFSSPYTNGFTEGCNNKIKVLKRNAYGYKKFQKIQKPYFTYFFS